jgi:hypothetical protein
LPVLATGHVAVPFPPVAHAPLPSSLLTAGLMRPIHGAQMMSPLGCSVSTVAGVTIRPLEMKWSSALTQKEKTEDN